MNLSPRRIRPVLIIMFFIVPEVLTMQADAYVVKGGGLTLTLSDAGEITGIEHDATGRVWRVAGGASIAGVRDGGTAATAQAPDGAVETIRRLALADHACTLRQHFSGSPEALTWTLEITGSGEPWSSSIETRLGIADAAGLGFWTSWVDPKLQRGWNDPLQPQPFRDLSLWYGQPSYEAMPYLGFHFNYHRLFSIPMATIMDATRDAAFTIIQSLDDVILDLSLDTASDGNLVFSHQHHRIGGDRPVRIVYRLVAHEADARAALGRVVALHPDYFDPPNPRAHQVAGTGAYSWYEGELDAARFHQMSFRVNWKASFDFPYMGMFLPPVPEEETWINFRDKPTSIRQMADYSRRMKELGFFVLNYFNVTEFGAHLRFPLPPPRITDKSELWKDSGSFIQQAVADGILYASDGRSPFYSWFRCVVMDPGGSDYQRFLLEQANAHIKRLPDSAGICIDRTDWLRYYNPKRDDGASWMWDRPVASLFLSWREIMAELGRRFHEADKLIYINNAMGRVDLMRDVDGMFDEFTFIPSHLNKCAFMCLRKPLIGWIEPRQEEFWSAPDAFMQQNLYMGCYPMAPFPGNDHSNLPHPDVERLFIDYGPLMDAMRGKKWVLAPHVIEVLGGEALANLFEVPGGLVAPVIHAKTDRVRVVVRGVSRLVKADGFEVDALHPGATQAVKIKAERRGDDMLLDVPVARGCAMLRLKQVWTEPASTYFFDQQKVEIRTAIPNAHLCLLPKEVSSSQTVPYTGPLTLTETTRLQILAQLWKEGIDVHGAAQFTKLPLPAPRIICARSIFDESEQVRLECTAGRATLHYTLDGGEPSLTSPKYEHPLSVSESRIIRARAFLSGATPSSISELRVYRRPPRPPRPDVFISDLQPATATTGWGGAVKKDRSIQSRPLTLRGETFARGMGTSAHSELAYPMKPEYQRFVAVVGIDDEMKDYAEASVIFQVWMDDKLLAESPLVRANDAWHLDVPLPPGGKMVRLVATDAGDGINCDHADWADAGFIL